MKKQILPLLALRGKMVYPDTSVYFEVSRPKSMAALEQAVNHEQQIFLVNQIDPSIDKPDQEDLYTVGTIAKILQMVKAGQGVLRVFVEGQTRARISSYTEVDGCVKVEVEELPDTGYPETPVEEEAFFRMLEDCLLYTSVFKMLICILNTLRSRIWDMVLFLFSVFWLQKEGMQ